jgi:hypothetical protein
MLGSWPYSRTSDKAERTARDKHSSLLQAFVNYGGKKFFLPGRLLDLSALLLGASFNMLQVDDLRLVLLSE